MLFYIITKKNIKKLPKNRLLNFFCTFINLCHRDLLQIINIILLFIKDLFTKLAKVLILFTKLLFYEFDHFNNYVANLIIVKGKSR